MGSTMLQRYCYAAAFVGVVAGIIGPSDVGWNMQGVATGLFLAALGLYVND